jgi:cAMP phosphodiesterase
MQIHVVGCDGGIAPGKLTTCFQLSESTLIDAGSVCGGLDFDAQSKIKDIFISHAHLDHIRDLGFLADNMLGETNRINLHALPEVNRHLKEHFFNNVIWPDFTRLPSPQNPFYVLHDIEAETEYDFGDITVLPVRVTHVVPSTGFVLEDRESSIVISGDTGPTERIWEICKTYKNIKEFFVELAFPNALQTIADASKHFTPATLQKELVKFKQENTPIALYHLKPKYAEQIHKEIAAQENSAFRFLNNGEVIHY